MILVLTQCFPPDMGGIQNLMAGLARALAHAGWPVRVLAERAAEPTRGDQALAGATVTRFGWPRPLRRRLKARAAHRLLATGAVEAIFCDSWKSAELVRPGRVPLAVLAHGNEFPLSPSGKKRRRIEGALAKADVVLASSRFTATLVRPYLAPSTRLEVVSPPIDPQPAADPAVRRAVTRRTAFARPLLVGLGRLEARKGFDRVIAALPALGQRWPGIGLALAGSGDDRARLHRVAEAAGVADRVHLLGRVDEATKAALLQEASVFVMPSRREGDSVEGFGIVYAEAAWYGVPAVAGAEGGGSDVVVHGETGLVVDGTDDGALTAALVRLLESTPTREAFGAAAATRIRATGTWQASLPRYLASVGLPPAPAQKGKQP